MELGTQQKGFAGIVLLVIMALAGAVTVSTPGELECLGKLRDAEIKYEVGMSTCREEMLAANHACDLRARDSKSLLVTYFGRIMDLVKKIYDISSQKTRSKREADERLLEIHNIARQALYTNPPSGMEGTCE